MEHPVDSEWNPYLEVPQVGLPEEVAHDVEARRGLDGQLLTAALQQPRQEQMAPGRRRREDRQPPSLMRFRIM